MSVDSSIQIIPYAGQSRDEFVSLFSEYTYGRYCSDWSLDLQASRMLELDLLYTYIQQNPANCWLATRGNDIVGFLGVTLSKWDTNFWGIKYANIDYLLTAEPDNDFSNIGMKRLVQTADQWCQREKMDFAAARVDVLNLSAVHALEEHSFKYIETTIANSYEIKHLDPVPSKDYRIRLAYQDEMDLLVDMVQDSFSSHRFYADKRFPKADVDEMYRQWVRNSLTVTSVWSTVVLEKSGKVLGYMTYRIEDLTRYFGMNFVKWRMGILAKDHRGKSNGVDLFVGAMKYMYGQADIVDSGITIRNIRSFNLHNKINFKVKCSSNTFHKWYL